MRFVIWDFLARWLRNQDQKLEILNSWSNMADWNAKIYLIGIQFGTRGFSASLIAIPSLTFINSPCQMQYGGQKCKKHNVMAQRFLWGIHFLDDWSFVRMYIRRFSGSLIMNLTLDFWDQYSVFKILYFLYLMWMSSKFFGIRPCSWIHLTRFFFIR